MERLTDEGAPIHEIGKAVNTTAANIRYHYSRCLNRPVPKPVQEPKPEIPLFDSTKSIKIRTVVPNARGVLDSLLQLEIENAFYLQMLISKQLQAALGEQAIGGRSKHELACLTNLLRARKENALHAVMLSEYDNIVVGRFNELIRRDKDSEAEIINEQKGE